MSIADVIKYEGDNSTFIWKHPCEDFNSMTQLIVHESQEAIFFMNGQALDVFGAGRYTLETQNIPLIGDQLKKTAGNGLFKKDDPFHCEVYFINKTVQMDLKWGTDSRVRFIEPTYGIPLEIGASGSMNMMVTNGKKLLIKLVGTMNGIAWDQYGEYFTKSLHACFKPMISNVVKSNLAEAILSNNVNLFEIDSYLDKLSATLKERLVPNFEEYGLTIPNFYVTSVVLPEEDPNFKRIRDLYTVGLQTKMAQAQAQVKTAQAQAEAEIIAAQRQTELERQTTQTEVAKRAAERTVIEAQAEAEAKKAEGFAQAEIMAAQGYNQKDVIQAEVQKAYAEGMGNMGSNGGSAGGGVASDMVSMMAGMKMAETMMGQMNGMMGGTTGAVNQPAQAPAAPAGATKFCNQCGATIPANSKFCNECGAPVVVNANKCPNCGAEIPAGSKFCNECGTKLQ